MMEMLLYTFCAYLTIHLLAYLPFLDLLRFGRKWMVAAVVGNMLIHLLGVFWLVSIGRPELVTLVGIAMVPISLVLYFLNIRLAPSKLLFTYMLLVSYQNIALGLGSFFAARMFHAGPRSLESGIICLALFALTWRPMYWLFRNAVRQVYCIDAPQLWRLIWLLPAIVNVLVFVFTGNLQAAAVGSWQFLLSRLSLLLCVALVYWVLLNALEGIQKQTILQQQLNFEIHLLEVEIQEQKKYSQLMLEYAQQLRRQRHDLRHQLTAIQGLSDPDNAPLQTYIQELLQAIPAAPRNYCENPAVNAIVSHYAAQCLSQNITVDIHIEVPDHTEGITDTELCIIFGNLLENAWEACTRMTQGTPFIRMRSSLEHGTLAVTQENSFEGKISLQDGKYLSSKRKGVGIGLSSIQAVAKAHGGDARFETQGAAFYSLVYWKIGKEC